MADDKRGQLVFGSGGCVLGVLLPQGGIPFRFPELVRFTDYDEEMLARLVEARRVLDEIEQALNLLPPADWSARAEQAMMGFVARVEHLLKTWRRHSSDGRAALS